MERPTVVVLSTLMAIPAYERSVTAAIDQVGYHASFEDKYLLSPGVINVSIPRSSNPDNIEQAVAVLLVVGYQYGSLLPDQTTSWVEAQYDHARRTNKPIMAFMASEDTSWPARSIDIDRTQIERFRRRLTSEIAVQLFSSPLDLQGKIVKALTAFRVREGGEYGKVPPSDPAGQRVRVLRLLLSSPGDVAAERDCVANSVFRFNQDAVEQRGIFVKLVRWEDMAPQIGPCAQRVINAQIGDYDLFVGIMWNRFGSPTDVAASGTKEEFDAAVESWKERGKPWIVFYFGKSPTNLETRGQIEQKQQVIEFREEVQGMGVVRSFSSPEEFEQLVYQDLLRITSNEEFLKNWTREQ